MIRPEKARHPYRSRRGFSLVEIAVVVMILGILAAAATASIRKVQLQARIGTYANDVRVFEAAFQQYYDDHGAWPPDVNRGIVPPGMEDYLTPASFTSVNSLGGLYDWDHMVKHNGVTYTAVITVRGPDKNTGIQLSNSDLKELDAAIDDGNLETGRFQLGYQNFPIYIIQP